MQPQKQLENYIYTQLQAGIHPNEIAQQLRGANWDEATISAAFSAVQATITPSTPEQIQQNIQNTPIKQHEQQDPSQAGASFQPAGKKRGRIKTAWLLLKHSLKVLKNNKQLLRYPFMGGVISLLVSIFFGIVMFASGDTFLYRGTDVFGQAELYFTAPGMALVFLYYVVFFFVIFFYNTGLAAHTLDIFKGKSEHYRHYMKLAWSKKGVIFVYSLITATVGVILRAIEQRAQWLGWLVSRIFGVLWTLANLFTIPIIAESDASAPSAIKQSARLFMSRWGENIAARITFGGLAFLVYLLLFIPFIFLLAILASAIGDAGLIVFVIVFIGGVILFATVETAASNVLSTALYYYAQYQQIPAAFDKDLLNSAFIPKKAKKGLFGRKK